MMATVFDVVDLLQLQEIWVRRPIAQAFSRLERRQTELPCPFEFRLKWLMPRLGQLRNSAVWQTSRRETHTDPAQMPMCAFNDSYLEVLYPESASPAQVRRQLFLSVYNHFVISQYQGDAAQTAGLLRALAMIRSVTPGDFMNEDHAPLAGSNFWIPVDLTDEVRALDTRYDSSQPDTPSAYVISESFWPLLVKATPADLQAAAMAYCEGANPSCMDDCLMRLRQLAELAHDWNRSSSVVGLYYQSMDDVEGG